MVNSLNGKRVLITGAANGIGYATATMFADAGARVIGLDLDTTREPMRILRCDLSREADIVGAVAATVQELGGIDVLVNNAGIMEEAPIQSITGKQIDRNFAINVRGAILVTREALPH